MLVPSLLRSRIALIALLGTFLIPVGMSSLRGLTHLLTCQQATNVPFTVSLPANGEPTILSASTITRDDTSSLCGGLQLDVHVAREGSSKVKITMPITNHTAYGWEGSVKLRLGGVDVPVRIGHIAAGKTREGVVHFHVDKGSHEITGSLLIGP
jgi:hypothetical protein